MADNTILNVGVGGDTFRSEDRTTFKTPVSLIDVGGVAGEALIGDGTNAMPVRGLAAADAALSGNPVPVGVRGSAAAPSDMSADNDVTIPWALRNGSLVCNLAAGGTLITATSTSINAAVTNTVTVGSHAVTNAGTFAVQVDGAALTSLQLIDDAIFVDDADWTDDTSKHMNVGGVYQSTPHTVTDGDVSPIQLTANGYQIVSVNGTVTVASHAVTNAGTFVVQVDGAALTALQLIDNIVVVDDAAFTLGSGSGVMMMGFAGTQSVNADDACALACTTAGFLIVSAVQSGTWNIGTVTTVTTVSTVTNLSQMSGTAISMNTGVRDAGSQRVTICTNDTITVASHAVTNAGTFAVQVDGAALTALQLIDDVVYAEDIAAQAADKGISVLAVRRDTPTALATTDNDYIQLTTDSAGRLWTSGPVTVVSGGIASGAVASGAIASGAVASGAFASGALAAGSIATGAIADMLVDDAAFTPATSRVMPTGFQADEASIDSVDEGDIGCPRMTLDRKVIVTNLAHTAGGGTAFYNLDVDESEDSIKTTAGMLYNFAAINTTNALLYLKFYNATVANVTVGTTTPLLTWPVPGNNDADGAGVVVNFPVGVVFDTAITIAATTSFADADTGAPGTNALIVAGSFK